MEIGRGWHTRWGTVTLSGLKSYLKRHKIKVQDPITKLGRRYPDGLPRGYKAKYSQAYHQLAIPASFAEEIASVLGTTIEVLSTDVPPSEASGNGSYDPYGHLRGMEVVSDPVRDERMSLESFLALDCKGCTSLQCHEHFEWLVDHRPDLVSHVHGQRAQCSVIHGRIEIEDRKVKPKKIRRKR